MTEKLPIVQNASVICVHAGKKQSYLVGSLEWFTWLEDATGFTYRSELGNFTARKEQTSSKRGGAYWRAYARRGGRLYHFYLGKSTALTMQRFQQCALAFSRKAQQHVGRERKKLVHPSRKAFFPAATPLVARAQECHEVRQLLLQPAVRLVTIVGPPGVGKSCVSIAVAEQMRSYFADALYFVSFSAVAEPARFLSTFAMAIGVEAETRQALLFHLQYCFQQRPCLLILDDIDPVLVDSAFLEELVATCPTLKIVISSRSPLYVRGEYRYQLRPLALPHRGEDGDLEKMTEAPALQLFLQRAQAFVHTFAVTRQHAEALVGICAYLDGIPLAIELLAPHVRWLSLEEMQQLLATDGLSLLAQGTQTLKLHHRSLTTAFDWSYQRLTEAEQRLFRSLAVFIGPFTFSLVEMLYQYAGDRSDHLVWLLSSLIDKNLLCFSPGQESSSDTLSLLIPLRMYAQALLRISGEDQKYARAHTLCYLTLVRSYEAHRVAVKQTVAVCDLDSVSGRGWEWLSVNGREQQSVSGNKHHAAATTQLLPPVQRPTASDTNIGDILCKNLTRREIEILKYVAQGWRNKQIAEHLVISPRTVSTHLTTIYDKIQVASRSAAIRYALTHGIA